MDKKKISIRDIFNNVKEPYCLQCFIPSAFLLQKSLFSYLKSFSKNDSLRNLVEIVLVENQIIKLSCNLPNKEQRKFLVRLQEYSDGYAHLNSLYHTSRVHNYLPKSSRAEVVNTESLIKSVISRTIINYFSEVEFSRENKLMLGLYLHVIVIQLVIKYSRFRNFGTFSQYAYYQREVNEIEFNPAKDYCSNAETVQSVMSQIFSDKLENLQWIIEFKEMVDFLMLEKGFENDQDTRQKILCLEINSILGLSGYEAKTLYYFILRLISNETFSS